MKVYLFTLLVRRSMYTEVPVTVPRHEADLLRAVHSAMWTCWMKSRWAFLKWARCMKSVTACA